MAGEQRVKYFETIDELNDYVNKSQVRDSGFKVVSIIFDVRVGKYLLVYIAEDLLLEEW